MPRPTLFDDGHVITLDLHGARVEEAVRLAEAAVVQAARHGRPTVKIIHGTSTSEQGDRRTIKTELVDRLHAGEFDRHVTSSYLTDGAMTLGLAPAPRPIRGLVRLADLS